MASTTTQSPLGDLPQAFFSLLRAQAKLSQDYYEALTGTKAPPIEDPFRAFQAAMPKPVCHVPPPCWMPKPLGEIVSHVNECGKACVRLVVTNCDRSPRSVSIRAEGVDNIELSPSTLQLGPMQRATVEACFEIPEATESGRRFDALIWVDGCRQHFLRWTISVGTAGLDSIHEVAVDDCPDYRHHWYDHFYCPRPCPSGRSTQVG